jgi:hypothetical protein
MRLPKSSKQNRQSRFIPGHHTESLPRCSIPCGNDAIVRSRFCHYTSWRLRTQSEITKDWLSTIRIKHLKMRFLSTKNRKLEQLKDYGKVTNNDTTGQNSQIKWNWLTMPSSCIVCPLDVMW